MAAETALVLRPMRLVELLDAAFRLYRRNFWTFVGIIALIQIPVSLLSLLPQTLLLKSLDTLNSGQFSAEYFIGLGLSFLVGIVQFFLVSGVATLTLTRAILSAYVGEKTSVFQSFSNAWPVLMRFMSVLVLIGLLMVVFYIWLLIPCVGWFSGLGILLTLSAAVLPFTVPIVILERHSATGTISRSWDLVRRRFWWVLGLMGVLTLLSLVLTGPSILLSSLSQSATQLGSLGNQTLTNTIIQSVVGVLASIIILPLNYAVVVLAYFDLRIRTEGIDLFVSANESEGKPISLADIAEMPTVKHGTNLVSGTEIGYFVILTLAAALLYAIFLGVVMLIMAGSMAL